MYTHNDSCSDLCLYSVCDFTCKCTYRQFSDNFGVFCEDETSQPCRAVRMTGEDEAASFLYSTLFFLHNLELPNHEEGEEGLSTRHLQGYNTDQQIYVNPSLTPVRQVLLAKACRLSVNFSYNLVGVDLEGLTIRVVG
ncbi:hypothetical protein J6590_061168 [Homalodisca vitripennis]|nr:hypothetical protein J6590_061168 [Homalodisca vitripennis]